MKQATKTQALTKATRNGDLVAGTPIFLRVSKVSIVPKRACSNRTIFIQTDFRTYRFLTHLSPPFTTHSHFKKTYDMINTCDDNIASWYVFRFQFSVMRRIYQPYLIFP